VKRVNAVEAEYWRRVCSEPPVVGDSTELLGFDCGGEQWVYEVCIPMGSLAECESASRKSVDLLFMEKLLKIIEDSGIPAPAPIEQR
jgi:L-galactono-1,4-lactone dehydrogenase